MKKRLNILWLAVILVGCAPIQETAKTVWGSSQETAKVMWGSSTRALEKARANAIIKTYRCELNDCFDAVLSLARAKTAINPKSYSEGHTLEDPQAQTEAQEPVEEGKKIQVQQTGDFFEVFKENRQKGYLVVMGVAGSVDTTEVGIFFSTYSPGVTKIEFSSLSTNAKRRLAQDVFGQLDKKFEVAL